jgi:hypothetical protein
MPADTEPTPLELMRAAVPRMTTDELVEFALEFYEELADRAATYAIAAEEGMEREIVIEGYAFASVAKDLVPTSGGFGSRSMTSKMAIRRSRDMLEHALHGTRSDDA